MTQDLTQHQEKLLHIAEGWLGSTDSTTQAMVYALTRGTKLKTLIELDERLKRMRADELTYKDLQYILKGLIKSFQTYE